MKTPLSRDEQIELMKDADKRHREFGEKWCFNPTYISTQTTLHGWKTTALKAAVN